MIARYLHGRSLAGIDRMLGRGAGGMFEGQERLARVFL